MGQKLDQTKPCCFRPVGMLAAILLTGWAVAGDKAWPAEPPALRVLQDQYPRAFFFRSAEGMASNRRITYEQWEATFERLMGIEGKVLDEEVPGRSLRNIDFFTRFKRRHPEQLVLLHYNGNARDPRDAEEQFFAGHWVYFNGARILEDVPAETGETDIRVDRPELFRVNIGRYGDRNDDIGLCRLDEHGRPDWRHAEQVQLIAIDRARKVIRVRRGCYGTKPLAFSAGQAYAAAHVTEGPWGRRSHLLWFYNYSTRCPRDTKGRTCAQVLAAELGRRFGPNGELATFDGIEFDVLHHRVHGGRGVRVPDCDADGRPDAGFFDGINTYGIGVIEFCRLVRKALGEEKLILADGMSLWNQRAFGILNGIESEGWPHLSDWEIRDWSGGLNRHVFWRENGRTPVFNYVNHKFVTHGALPGDVRRPPVPFSVHRLVFAAAVMTDSAICYSYAPRPEPGERFGIWDELRMGQENRPGWLGRPLGPPVRMAKRQPDLLEGQGTSATSLIQRCRGETVRFEVDGAAVKVTTRDPNASELRFRIVGIPTDGSDLFISLAVRAVPQRGYPPEMARVMWLGIAQPAGKLVRPDLPPSGMCLRGGEEIELREETGATVRYFKARRL
ncbi:MAG: hypothetical protein GXP27_11575, partial [Planctomycetes bacterium]|nr:hypothetical protein [Planctomycetota bacterium]